MAQVILKCLPEIASRFGPHLYMRGGKKREKRTSRNSRFREISGVLGKPLSCDARGDTFWRAYDTRRDTRTHRGSR